MCSSRCSCFWSAIAAFWQERFFVTNLANLDQLNAYFPYLLVFFIPAIAMSLWAEEKKLGTEDLLMTLPAADWEIVVGKYLAAVCIYTVALLFSLSHVVVLSWLGRPDPGLMMTTYCGYWLMGSALLAVAMVASLLTENLTVAFIMGAVFCGFFVFLEQAGAILTGGWQKLAERISVVAQFRDLATGVVTLHALVYFMALTGLALYLNIVILSKRRWPTGDGAPPYGLHYGSRARGVCGAGCGDISRRTVEDALGCDVGESSFAESGDDPAVAGPRSEESGVHTGVLES